MQTGTTPAGDTAETVPTPPERRVPERPVFVDASGRRQRRVRRVGRILVVPAVAYIGLMVSTLLGGPTVDSPYLPLPAGPHTAPGPSGGPHPVTRGGVHGQGGTGGQSTGTGGTDVTGVVPAPGASVGATPTAGATHSATQPAAGVTHGRSTHTAVPPGASHHPTKKARAQA